MFRSLTAKVRTNSLTCTLAVSALWPASHLMAQTRALGVVVPFAFHLGSQTLPAGTYRLDLNSDYILKMGNRQSTASGNAMTQAEQSKAPDHGKLIFHRYGSRYFLAEVWEAGNPRGRRIIKGREEKEAQLALNAPKPLNLELALVTSSK